MRRAFITAALVLSAMFASSISRGEERTDPVGRLIDELRLEEAETAVRDAGETASSAYHRARLSLHRGRFAEGLASIRRSLELLPSYPEGDPRPELERLLKESKARLGDHVEVKSADGRLVVRTPKGRAEILAPYALERLRRADEAYAAIFGAPHPGPIRVDFVRGPEDLARVSTLDEEAIHTTGTIALCKWDRMLVTSPEALARGYPWLDTIAHELAHLYLSRAARENAPVWFHEGLAKVLERLPSGVSLDAPLDPASRALLARHHAAGTLLPFSAFHPSVALLPSQEQAALAYAEASTFVSKFLAEHGTEGLRQVVHRIAHGAPLAEALHAVSGKPFTELEAEWRRSLEGIGDGVDVEALARRFVADARDVDDLRDVKAKEAKKALRLGDLLWERRRPKAATAEYARGVEIAPNDPILLSRMGRAALEAGDADRAADAARRALALHPDHAPAHSLLARALALSGRADDAARAARDAIAQNPFDPSPHCVLSEASSDKAERARERRACERLGAG
jgi:tetratricopeptide (TPR) repeat protein